MTPVKKDVVDKVSKKKNFPSILIETKCLLLCLWVSLLNRSRKLNLIPLKGDTVWRKWTRPGLSIHVKSIFLLVEPFSWPGSPPLTGSSTSLLTCSRGMVRTVWRHHLSLFPWSGLHLQVGSKLFGFRGLLFTLRGKWHKTVFLNNVSTLFSIIQSFTFSCYVHLVKHLQIFLTPPPLKLSVPDLGTLLHPSLTSIIVDKRPQWGPTVHTHTHTTHVYVTTCLSPSVPMKDGTNRYPGGREVTVSINKIERERTVTVLNDNKR